MSQLEVDKIIPQSGTTLTIGDSGDTINFADGQNISIDTNTLYIDSTNNRVGIGTTSPSYELQVQDTGGSCFIAITSNNTNESTLLLGDSDSASIGRVTYRNSDNSLAFNTNGSEAIRIDSSGNVGIGVTSMTNKLVLPNASYFAMQDTSNLESLAIRANPSNAMEFLTGGSERMSIDSSGRVLIGTTTSFADSNSDDLQISGSANTGMIIKSGTSSYGSIYFGDGTTGSARNEGIVRYNHSDNGMQFWTNASERMRIDSSGRLILAKTSTAIGDVGISLDSNGKISATRSSDPVFLLNRLSTDGVIADFRKDGATVGLIGAISGDLSIGTGDTGIRFNDGGENIFAFNTNTSSTRDNAVDLGASGGRWKDLYLGGGLYVGGTGTANKLDDYEEGTWTPSLSISSSGASGYYTVVGNIVHAYFDITATTSGSNVTINNFPFATKGSTPIVIGGSRETALTGYFWQIEASASNTSAYLIRYDNNKSISTSYRFQGSLIYQKS